MLFLDKKKGILDLLFFIPYFSNAQLVKIITNHVGYKDNKAKQVSLHN